MRTRTLHIVITCAGLVLAGCNATRWVPAGKHLLVRNVMTVEPGTLDADQLQSIVKQKTNKRVLGRMLYLDLYNLRDPEKVVRKRARKDSLCVLRNEQRKLKNKSLKACDRSSLGRNGEPPVILDSLLTERTALQIRLYAAKEGYFAAKVSDSTHFTHHRIWPFSGWGTRHFRKPKAAVEYVVQAGRPWTFCQVTQRVDDPAIAALLRGTADRSPLKVGDRFDSDVLDKERTRITDLLKENGYLYFTRDMVLFDADTSAGDREIDLVVSLERPVARSQRGLQGTPAGTPYYLDSVTIDLSRHTAANITLPFDTTWYNGYTILYRGAHPAVRPKALLNQITLRPGERFQQSNADRMYRRLTNLRLFDRVDIGYDTLGIGRLGHANARIGLVPSKRQSFSAEGFGTNRGGALGTTVSFSYRHKNLFRSMASLQASLSLGFEAQQQLNGQSTSTEGTGNSVGNDVLFNTLSIGPEVTLRLPKPLLFQRLFSRSSDARTSFSALYNFQRRPDYTRTLSKVSLGVEWSESKYNTVAWNPMEINIINIPRKSDAFAQFLATANDAVLTDSYTAHLIAGQRLIFTRNTQDPAPKRNVLFLRGILETAGNLLYIGHHLLDNAPSIDANDKPFYKVTDVRFAQFAKLDMDVRVYHRIHDKSSVVYRIAAGAGLPYGNLNVLPFESSFFGGGANSIRAWRARSLGPGSYRSDVTSFDRIGEMRIEGNIEYRFKVFGYLEGALFTDAGNIWTLKPDPARPNGEFNISRFTNDVAIGTGIGARLNFDFFIIRFDLGLKTKDPGLPGNEQWLFQHRTQPRSFGDELNLNLGIGYPF